LDTDTFTWSRLRISGEPPEGRFGHTINISGSEILLFGGWTLNSGARGGITGGSSSSQEISQQKDSCNYFMIWNTETMSWKQGRYIGNPPTQRYGHTSTAIGPHLLIFGGWEFSKAQNEIIVLREYSSSVQSGSNQTVKAAKVSRNSLNDLAQG
jgi:host cell factor